MNALDRFEELMERLIEGPFERLFKKRLHPTDLARALAGALEAGRMADGRGGCLAPNHYRVLLSQADYDSFQANSTLNAEIEAIERYLTGLMVEAGCQSNGPLRVLIEAAAEIVPGRLDVTADYLDVETPPASAIEETQRLTKKRLTTSARQWRLRLPDREIELGMPVVRIGRHHNNDVVLPDRSVADYHAQLRWRDGAYYLQPLSRAQFLRLNQQPLSGAVPLKSGDLLQIGTIAIQINLQI